MKIAHVNGYLAPKGGVETYLLSLLPRLAASGLEQVFVYGTGDPAQYQPSLQVPGIEKASFRLQDDVRAGVQSFLRNERPDVVHVHNVQNVATLEACLDYGPTILHTHDHRWICPASSFFYRRTQEVCSRTCGLGCFRVTLTKHCVTLRPGYAAYFYHRGRWTIRNAHRFARVIAPCADAKTRLVQAGFEAATVEVLPYFCPVEPAAHPRPAPDHPTVTYIGRIAPNKGHEYFVRALGELPAHVRGVMVGSFTGESEQEVRRLAREAGCEERLALRPWATRQEVIEVLDATSVFVFPSLWPETLGIVGLEAMARGVPVVGSDLGGVREWLRDGENGFLVEPKSTQQIRDAVLKLLASNEELLAYGDRALETIREEFLPVQHVDRLMKIYKRAAMQRSHAVGEAIGG